MTVDELLSCAESDRHPPDGLSDELLSLWHARVGNWDSAHNIAQDIHTPMGSWLHALLHLIEGDTGNAGYWFRKAGRQFRSVSEIDSLWLEIAHELLD